MDGQRERESVSSWPRPPVALGDSWGQSVTPEDKETLTPGPSPGRSRRRGGGREVGGQAGGRALRAARGLGFGPREVGATEGKGGGGRSALGAHSAPWCHRGRSLGRDRRVEQRRWPSGLRRLPREPSSELQASRGGLRSRVGRGPACRGHAASARALGQEDAASGPLGWASVRTSHVGLSGDWGAWAVVDQERRSGRHEATQPPPWGE